MSEIVKWALRCVLYLLAQFFIFRHLVVADVAVAHVFLLPLLLLPFEMSRPWLFITAFVMGLVADSFTNPMGPQTIACLMAVGLREFWITAISPQLAIEGRDEAPLLEQPFSWHISYLPVMVLVFELTYFTVGDWGLSWLGLMKALLSAAYTTGVSLLFLYLIHKRS